MRESGFSTQAAVHSMAGSRRTLLKYGVAMLLGNFGALVPSTVAWANASSPYYRVAFENDHVRVVELLASQGANRGMHLQVPAVLVSASKARFEITSVTGGVSIVDFNEGQILWHGTAERRLWRLVAGEAHLFLFEIKSALSGVVPATKPVAPTDSTVIDPDTHHVVLDNEHVRVIDGFGAPGTRSALHTHPPSALVSLTKSRFRVTIKGKTRIFDFEPSMVRWLNHFEHTWQNLAGDGHVIIVEVKSAHDDPSFRRR